MCFNNCPYMIQFDGGCSIAGVDKPDGAYCDEEETEEEKEKNDYKSAQVGAGMRV